MFIANKTEKKQTKAVYKGVPLTSSSFINAVEADDVALLRQANQREHHVELVARQQNVGPLAGSHQRHDARLGIGIQPRHGEQLGDASSCDLTVSAVLAHDGVKGPDVALGHVLGRQQAADHLGAAALLARRGHVPGRRGAAVVVEEAGRVAARRGLFVEKAASRTRRRARGWAIVGGLVSKERHAAMAGRWWIDARVCLYVFSEVRNEDEREARQQEARESVAVAGLRSRKEARLAVAVLMTKQGWLARA